MKAHYKNYHNGQDFHFSVHPNDLITNFLLNTGEWERHLHSLLESYSDDSGVFLDIGAHVGLHSIKSSFLFRNVIAFEPFPANYRLLRENIRESNRRNVIALPYALADDAKTFEIREIHVGNSGTAALAENIDADFSHEGKVFCDTITLDALHLNDVSLMKIDTEDMELSVLQGGLRTIERCRPVIVLECWSSFGQYSLDFTATRFDFLLSQMDYKLEHVSGPDFLFIPGKR